MADLYSQPFRNPLKRPAHEMSGSNPPSAFPSNGAAGMMYPQLLSSAHNVHSQNSSSDDLPHHDDPETPPGGASSKSPQQDCKMETKPQATFLTKLYALLERQENHHMIRWDPQGEHIIVERPEQLALHVLPSIYRQSRFASFSRQLNIYGFMRKVNLRNIDPAIDDPDASTWSHPTLNRSSPADVVANFKRRVPPRLPKPRKRGELSDGNSNTGNNNGPRSAIQVGPAVPPSVPSSVSMPPSKGRARGFSAPGSFNPLAGSAAGQWGTGGGGGYPRSALPPLSVPPELSHQQSGVYHRTSLQNLHPSSEELQHHHQQQQHHSAHQQHHHHLQQQQQQSYAGLGRDSPSSSMFMPHNYTYPESNTNGASWYLPPLNTAPISNSGSLSSLLNPTSGLSRGGVPPLSAQSNTSGSNYPSPFSSVPMSNSHSSSSLSPDSRPTTGYSVASSMSSLPYDPEGPFEYRPRSGNGRPLTPGSAGGSNRPKSSTGPPSSSLSVRRNRRHSQAISPYPSPYSSFDAIRPLTAPDGMSGLPRVRSMMTMSPSSDGSGNHNSNGNGGNNGTNNNHYQDFNPAHADFAYSAHGPTSSNNGQGPTLDLDTNWMSNASGSLPSSTGQSLSPAGGLSPGGGQSGMGGMGGSLRPSTSTSSLSGQSSNSATHTPPIMENFGESDINRFSPDFNFFSSMTDVIPIPTLPLNSKPTTES